MNKLGNLISDRWIEGDGDGKILACLSEHEAEVGEGCKKAVADTVGE